MDTMEATTVETAVEPAPVADNAAILAEIEVLASDLHYDHWQQDACPYDPEAERRFGWSCYWLPMDGEERYRVVIFHLLRFTLMLKQQGDGSQNRSISYVSRFTENMEPLPPVEVVKWQGEWLHFPDADNLAKLRDVLKSLLPPGR